MSHQQKKLIEDLEQQTSEAIDFIKNEIKPLSESQINWRPHKGKWSIAECIEHLRLASSGYFKGIEKGVLAAQAKEWKTNGTFRRNLIGKSMHFFVDPSGKVPIPAPGKFKPEKKLTHLCIEAYLDQLHELKNALKKSYDINLEKPKVTSPIVSLLSMQLGDVYIMLVRHCWRHIHQIKGVMNHPDFPN